MLCLIKSFSNEGLGTKWVADMLNNNPDSVKDIAVAAGLWLSIPVWTRFVVITRMRALGL
jgi:hypothetical protein